MASPDYLIQNCKAEDFEFACPKRWGELKPSLMAAVRHCDHCQRKVYLCTTDADLKLYTSLNYCIAVVKQQTQAEKEWEARTKSMERPAGGVGRQFKGETLIGVMLPRNKPGTGRPAPSLRVVPKDLDAYEIPAYLRKQLPDTDDEK
jgi:hypothetical protein